MKSYLNNPELNQFHSRNLAKDLKQQRELITNKQ
jgi:hypothetical protein